MASMRFLKKYLSVLSGTFPFLLTLAIFPKLALTFPVQWPESEGGNGHFYQPILVPDGLTWEQAKSEAVSRGGYLATITSQEENQLVHSLVASEPNFWLMATFPIEATLGPWIGLFQPDGSEEPDGGFQWVTNEPFVFNNWLTNQPNNINGVENSGAFFGRGLNNFADTWNDFPNDGEDLGAGVPNPISYIIEFDSIPEPSSVLGLLAFSCFGGLGWLKLLLIKKN